VESVLGKFRKFDPRIPAFTRQWRGCRIEVTELFVFRWDDDVVFKNCARGDVDKKERRFINDTLRSDFHKKFMEKYIKWMCRHWTDDTIHVYRHGDINLGHLLYIV